MMVSLNFYYLNYALTLADSTSEDFLQEYLPPLFVHIEPNIIQLFTRIHENEYQQHFPVIDAIISKSNDIALLR
jgi:hypothetical protein